MNQITSSIIYILVNNYIILKKLKIIHKNKFKKIEFHLILHIQKNLNFNLIN